MNLGSLSNEELTENLRALREGSHPPAGVSQLRQVEGELHAHRIELEMQNRALREAQTELEQAVQRFADLFDNLPLACLTLSSSGQIAAANRSATTWLQPDKRGLVGRSFRTFLEPYDAGRFAAHLEACLGSREPSSLELMLKTAAQPDGVPVQIALRSSSPTAGGEPRVHITITDISKLKHAERMLEQTNREQETFNRSVAHDLRAPLVTISNYAKIVLSDHGGALESEGRGMLQRIESAAARMEHTLQGLMEFNSLAREEVLLQSVSLGEAMRALLVEHRQKVQEKQAEIVVDAPLPAVLATPGMLSRVLGNLLTNALKYTAEGQPPRVRISAEVGTTRVILKVRDEGIGIEPDCHERIFRIFERLHGYSRYPGSGMGLAIARRAVERMNGRIWVESEPGKGSCFFVELAKG